MYYSTSQDSPAHSPALLELLGFRVTDKLTGEHSLPHPRVRHIDPLVATDYIAETTINAVDTALGYQSTAWNRTSLGGKRVPFKRFVWDVIRRASVKMSVLLTTLVYISRARPHLHIETEDWACERVFLGALMVASKVCLSVNPRYSPFSDAFSIVYQ